MPIEKRWEIAQSAPAVFLQKFAQFPALICQLFYNRNLKTKNAISTFLDPDYKTGLYDPFRIQDMAKASDRIFRALAKQEKILIYGDYDADGITATTLLYKTLKFLGAQRVTTYIPHRQKEGYGLNSKSVQNFAQKKVKLVITVDCGISNRKQVAAAQSQGIDVIVTDHHLVPAKLPRAYAILNVRRKSDHYPFKELAGVGIAFKLACALLGQDQKHGAQECEAFEKWLLDLVAIGTVADLASLVDENRTLVKYGLIILNYAKRLGLKQLYQTARLNPKISPLTTYHIGYQIAPRLNAAGRMVHADAAFQLLLTDSEREAQELALKLEATNRERQKLTSAIFGEAEAQIGKIEERRILLAASPQWSAGIAGLVAGKLCDQYYRPTLIIERGEKHSTGSARSIEAFDITAALDDLADLLIRHGGHKTAAGFTLATENIALFYERLETMAQAKMSPADLRPSLEIDAPLPLTQISWSLYDLLEKFSPFGESNSIPRFLARRVRVVQMRTVGSENKHLKLTLQDQNQKTFEAIGFGLREWLSKIIIGDKIDLVYELSSHEWNGRQDLELKIIDLKIS